MLEQTLQSIARFSGVPAKFSGAPRLVTILVVLDMSGTNHDVDQAGLTSLVISGLTAEEWGLSSVDAVQGWGGWDTTAYTIKTWVNSEYTAAQVKSSITRFFKDHLNANVWDVTVNDPGSSGNNAAINPPSSTVTPKPLVVPPIDTTLHSIANAVDHSNSKPPEEKGLFDKIFFDGAGKVTGAGIGIILVVAVVAIAGTRR